MIPRLGSKKDLYIVRVHCGYYFHDGFNCEYCEKINQTCCLLPAVRGKIDEWIRKHASVEDLIKIAKEGMRAFGFEPDPKSQIENFIDQDLRVKARVALEKKGIKPPR